MNSGDSLTQRGILAKRGIYSRVSPGPRSLSREGLEWMLAKALCSVGSPGFYPRPTGSAPRNCQGHLRRPCHSPGSGSAVQVVWRVAGVFSAHTCHPRLPRVSYFLEPQAVCVNTQN